jgi:S1-C subfamily serine protease
VDRLGSPPVVDPPSGVAGEGSRAPRLGRLGQLPRRWLVAVVVVTALLAVGTFALTRGPETPPITATDVDKAVKDGIARAQEELDKAPPDAAAAYRVALPSLVTIATQRTGTERGTGAGVVASAEGAVLTALHVVEGARAIEVTFSDGTSSPATVEEQDKDTDIAVLTPERLPQVVVPAVLGGGAQVGDDVFALGHPLGLNGSLSAGVVSALDRKVKVSSSQTLEGLIQFDAAVNPGNSGGPLLDKGGQVIGIVTGLANPSEQNFFVGIGFAVPIATAGGVAGAPPQ